MLYWEGEVNSTALLTKLSPWKDYDFENINGHITEIVLTSSGVSAGNGIWGRSLVTAQDGHSRCELHTVQ
jgi:hypothetical protein